MPEGTPNYGWRIPLADGTDLIVPDDVRVPITSIDTQMKSEENARVSGDNAINSGLNSAWTNFTVQIKAPSTLSLGAAAVTARYKDIGTKTRLFFISIVRAADTNIGSGDYTFTMVMPGTQAYSGIVASAMYFDASPFKEYPCVIHGTGAMSFVMLTCSTNDRVASAVPVAPAAGDAYIISGFMEMQ